ncbi:MAG TPA: cytidylate kinase-like family protein [Syntrophales bacterium]|nr:cytidylate kinase-like family protein [Syntrophales bacterium]
MEKMPRSLDKIIENQVRKWEVVQKKKYKKPIRPVITLSRLPGCGAREMAERIAEELKIDFWDDEIIEEIAKSSSVSRRVIESLDEQDRSILDDWMGYLDESQMWSHEYFQHLTKVVGSIGAHGHALILGRGAGYILPVEVSLRVLLVAPQDTRIRNVMEEHSCTEKEARASVRKTETERRGFIKKYFQADLTDPNNYDLTINTANLGLDVAAAIVIATFNSKKWYNYSVKR